MKSRNRFAATLSLALVAAAASAVPLVDETRLIGVDSRTVERTFDVSVTGQYQLQLVDGALPAALASLQASIASGAEELLQLDQAGTANFDVTAAGTLVVRVVGEPGAGQTTGIFSVAITRLGDTTPAFGFSAGVADPSTPAPGQVTLSTSFSVQQAATLDCTLRDTQFPAALASLRMIVTRGSQVFCNLQTGAGNPVVTGSYPATPGDYQLFAIGEAAAGTGEGLFTIGIEAQGGAESVYETAVPVGTLAAPEKLVLPTTGMYTLTLSDLGIGPQDPLDRLAAALLNGSAVLGTRNGPGAQSIAASAGGAQLFVSVATDDSSGGTYGIDLSGLAGQVFGDVVAVPGQAVPTAPAFQFATDLAASGQYRLTLTDFQFLSGFSTLSTAVTQGALVLGTFNGAGSIDFNAEAGRLDVVVLPTLPAANARGLFGLEIRGLPGGTILFDATQGVGGEFTSLPVTVTAAGSYDLTLSDFGFPDPFANLSLALTRGATRELVLFGAGTGRFAAPAGDYTISILADPAAGGFAGLLGLHMDASPPAPAITLTASPASVESGDTTTLNWSAQGADTCRALGGWTGARPTTGMAQTGAITAQTVFTLECTGSGGTSTANVTVTIRNDGGGGGGSASLTTLLALVLLALAAASRKALVA
jgi:hypothetical protein